jgi:hypothetical protein
MTDNYNNINTLHNLLDYDIRKFTIAEIQLQKILRAWINKAGSLKLKTVLQKYQDAVEKHIQKMQGFYEEEGIASISLFNRVMQAFIDETEEKLNYCSDAAIKDACILASVQTINHFKISTYGTARAFSNALGLERIAHVFHEAETTEKKIDDRLTQLAEHEINIEARAPIVLPY